MNKISMRQTVTTAGEPSSWTMEEAGKVFKKLPAVIDALQMTPSSLAKSCGCDRRSIYRWMSGTGISFYHALKLVRVLETRSRSMNQTDEDLWEDDFEEEDPEELARIEAYNRMREEERDVIEKQRYERGLGNRRR